MPVIHKSVCNPEDVMHVIDGINFKYSKTLCRPNVGVLPWAVDTDEDENVDCPKCIKLMETEHARS